MTIFQPYAPQASAPSESMGRQKSLPGTVQGQDDLLVFFLDRDEKHIGTGDGLCDGGGILCVVLAATASHAVGRDELGCHQFDGVAVLADNRAQ